MKKLYKKRDSGNPAPEDDAQRNRLFGKSKSKSPNPSSNPYAQPSAATGNPYAQSPPPGGNPYAAPRENASPDPYAQSSDLHKSSAPYSSTTLDYKSTSSIKPPGADRNGGYGGMKDPYAASSYAGSTRSGYPPSYNTADPEARDKSPASADGYGGGSSSSRYHNPGAYGNQGGYGGDRWGNSAGGGGGDYGDRLSSHSRGPGGYGGFGRTKSHDSDATEAGKAALFGDAPKRLAASSLQGGYGLPPDEDPAQGGQSGAEGSDSHGYGTYRDRQLTAEEEEEEEVNVTKTQIREIKRQDVSSTRNALRIAEEAEQSGRETLERLGAQGERIHNTEKNLDLASNQNRLAEDKAKQLKHLNRSMFAMSVGNPFNKGSRERHMDEQIMSIHHTERAQREATRAAAYDSAARRGEHARQVGGDVQVQKRNLAERSKYQFEADSEDEAMEDEIDGNLELLGGAAGRLNQLGRAMGSEIEEQNKHLDRIAGKADRVDDQIHMNRSRLDRIR